MAERDERGKFIPKLDGLGKRYGVRIHKELDSPLAKFAVADEVTATEWCRVVVEAAIRQRLEHESGQQERSH